MDYKPSDVFLTVTDVFVVMLPGGLLLALGGALFHSHEAAGFPGSASAWIFLAIASYIVGHLVSGVGALVEDRINYSTAGQARIANEFREKRALVTAALKRVVGDALENMDVRRTAHVLIQMRSASLAAALARRDADRRLFRNLIVVVSVLGVLAIGRVTARVHRPVDVLHIALVALVALGVLWLLADRYSRQDRNYTRDIFDYCLLLDGLGELRPAPPAPPAGSAGHPRS